MQSQKVTEGKTETISYYRGTEVWSALASQRLLHKFSVSTQDPARRPETQAPPQRSLLTVMTFPFRTFQNFSFEAQCYLSALRYESLEDNLVNCC